MGVRVNALGARTDGDARLRQGRGLSAEQVAARVKETVVKQVPLGRMAST